MRIDALIFDLDNTLWEVEPVILRAEERLAEFLAQSYPRVLERHTLCLLYTSPSPRDRQKSRMPSSA